MFYCEAANTPLVQFNTMHIKTQDRASKEVRVSIIQ